jgi:hypothetical protein
LLISLSAQHPVSIQFAHAVMKDDLKCGGHPLKGLSREKTPP